MAGGGVVLQLWNEWAVQVLVLLSFSLQVFLFIFGGTRWRNSSTVLRVLLWLVYQLADSTATYTLGHLSIGSSPHEHRLVAFWAPFLLLHLGGQDTITAYALEDNRLWSGFGICRLSLCRPSEQLTSSSGMYLAVGRWSLSPY
jgi:hypothetical protein